MARVDAGGASSLTLAASGGSEGQRRRQGLGFRRKAIKNININKHDFV